MFNFFWNKTFFFNFFNYLNNYNSFLNNSNKLSLYFVYNKNNNINNFNENLYKKYSINLNNNVDSRLLIINYLYDLKFYKFFNFIFIILFFINFLILFLLLYYCISSLVIDFIINFKFFFIIFFFIFFIFFFTIFFFTITFLTFLFIFFYIVVLKNLLIFLIIFFFFNNFNKKIFYFILFIIFNKFFFFLNYLTIFFFFKLFFLFILFYLNVFKTYLILSNIIHNDIIFNIIFNKIFFFLKKLKNIFFFTNPTLTNFKFMNIDAFYINISLSYSILLNNFYNIIIFVKKFIFFQIIINKKKHLFDKNLFLKFYHYYFNYELYYSNLTILKYNYKLLLYLNFRKQYINLNYLGFKYNYDNYLLNDIFRLNLILKQSCLKNIYYSNSYFIESNLINFNKNLDNSFTNKFIFNMLTNQTQFSSNNQFSNLLFKKNIQKEDLFTFFFNDNNLFNYNNNISLSNKWSQYRYINLANNKFFWIFFNYDYRFLNKQNRCNDEFFMSYIF